MASVSQLRAVLLSAFSARGLLNGEQEFFQELMAHKPHLAKLYDVGPRNAQEQRELESGKVLVNGRPLAVNADFARQAIFISQQLDCSERYVASLLQEVMAENPNMSQEQYIEAAILEFHLRRRQIAECLRYIFEASELAEARDSPQLYVQLDLFVRQQLLSPPGGRGMSLAFKVFQEAHNLGNVLAKAQAARQNARSNTIVQGNNAALGSDILSARCDSLRYERRTLATVLYLIGRMGYLAPAELQRMIDWLDANPRHPMTYYVLSAALAAFDLVDPQSVGGQARGTMVSDKGFVAYMKKKLDVATEWKEPGLKATILLKWTLFLTETRRRDPSLENVDGFKTDELETQIWNAVQGDCFTYLVRMVGQLQKKQASNAPYPMRRTDPSVELPTDDFKPAILEACEALVRSLIVQASPELRKIKQRQEDLLLAGTRTDRTRMFRGSTSSSDPEKANVPPRNDLAVLFSLIGLLYATLPAEKALHFWGQRATYIERVESASGKLPAFLQWAVWSTQARDMDMSTALYDMLAGLAKGQQCSELAYNFLARGGGEGIAGSSLPSATVPQFSTGPAVSWSSIFGLLDSWAVAGAGPRANQAPPQSMGPQNGFGGPQTWQTQQPQQPQQQLAFTQHDVLLAQSFLRLLSTVVTHSVAVRITICGHARFRAIPTLVSLIPLGTLAAFCEPGAGIPGVEICRSVWTLMERMEVINVRVSGGIGGSLPAVKGVEVELDEVESAYKMYPATIPFLRLLSTLVHTPKGIPLRDRLADAEPVNTIPETLGHPYRAPGIGPFSSFVIDNYLRPSDRWRTNDLCLCFIERCLASYDLESLVTSGDAVLQLAIHPGYDIMKRILTPSPLQASIFSYIRGLAEEEPYFRTTIVRVLRIVHRVLDIQDIFLDSGGSSVIGEVHPASYFMRFDQTLSYSREHVPALAAYVAYPAYPELMLLSVKILTALSTSSSLTQLALLIDQSDESQIMDADVLEDSTGAGAPDLDEPSASLTQAIRLAVLELFIRNTHPDRPYPNVAHFLLFGGASAEDQIQDPHALGARRSCGVPRLKGRAGTSRQSAVEPLFVTLPALAERCYHVIFQLCKHPRTSEASMRYLRTREDFFARHLAAIPFKVPPTEREPFIEVMYGDGTRVMTAVAALASFLRLRSWVLDLVALELHVLTNKGHHKGASELLELLFGNEEDLMNEGADGWQLAVFRPFHEVGQSHLRMIEFIQSLDFDWSDSLTFLGELNLQSCLRTDEAGCEIVDRTALLSLLTLARRTLHMQGRIMTCAIENIDGRCGTLLEGYEAWRRLLDMTLMKCFERLPHDRRENMLFDVYIPAPPDHTQSAGGDIDAGSLPAERLYTLLRSLLDCIVDSNRIELVRGNLYASLIITSTWYYPPTDRWLQNAVFRASLRWVDFRRWAVLCVLKSAGRFSVYWADFDNGSIAILKTVLERLVAIVSRDAIDGTEVWKTVAFMLLDSLVRLSRSEKQSGVLQVLSRHGFYDLNALYVYEAKISLLIRMAQSRQGADRLLEVRTIPILADCDYLDARPEADQAFLDQDSFLPSAVVRYHQLFMPALQLVSGMLALQFLASHRDTIILLLKNEVDDLSLSVMEEMRLLVSLCANVLQLVPKSELVLLQLGFWRSPSAILSLAAKCLGSRRWSDGVKPQTDAELHDAAAYAPGFGAQSQFHVRKTIIAYLGTASDFTEPEFTLVMSPVVTTPRQEERPTRFLATVPTIGDAIEALNGLCDELAKTFKTIVDLSAELVSKDHIRVDNIQEIVNISDPGLLENLDIRQKQSLISRELEHWQLAAKRRAHVALQSLEMLLLLLWRHLQFYAEGQHIDNPDLKGTLAHTLRFSSSPDIDSLRSEAARKLTPALQRLQALDLSEETLGSDWHAYEGYVEIMARRLKDTAGLDETPAGAQNGH
ncbi:nucleoporin Nup186/Nup192/Nup205 [Amylocystis lapponica]|nr:nucleoporin Nup186/Nup192/Nup205 [Amylocystis lapponica]